MCMHIYAHLELRRGSAAVAKLEGALVAVAALDVVGAGPRIGPVEHQLPQLREVVPEDALRVGEHARHVQGHAHLGEG